MNENLYNTILTSLEKVYGGQTTPEDRHNAGQILEGFKDRDDGMPYALYILQTPSPRHTDEVRHFALHCLERMVKERWNPNTVSTSTNGAHSGKLGQSSHPGVPSEFSLTQKQQIKDAMLQVMAFGTRDILSEAHFIKVKVADLVAQLAERDYPTKWEGFLEQMMQAWATGPTQAELAMMVLGALIEDCSDVDFRNEINSSRRDAVLRGINESLPRIMPTLYRFLLQQWMAYQSSANASNGAEKILINGALDVLAKILLWVKEKYLAASVGTDFLEAIAQLTTVRELRNEALLCLNAMCAIKLPRERMYVLMETVTKIVDAVKHALAQESVPLSGSLEVHQMLSACVEEILIRNGSRLAEEKDLQDANSHNSKVFSEFLKQVLELTKIPSRRTGSGLLEGWKRLWERPSMKQMPALVDLASQLLTTCTGYFVPVRFQDDVTDDVIVAEEFLDEDDYLQFLPSFKSQVRIVISHISGSHPLIASRLISEEVQKLLQHHAVGRDHLDERGLPTMTTEACKAWGAITALTKDVVDGLPKWVTGPPSPTDKGKERDAAQAEVRGQCLQMLRPVTEAVINWQPNGSILITQQLLVIEAYRWMFVLDNTMLQAVFSKLFGMLEAPDPHANPAAAQNSPTITASPEVEAVRIVASRCLVTVASATSKALAPALSSICERVNNVLNTTNPSAAVRTNQLELLLEISKSVENIDQRRGFIVGMVKAPVSTWVSDGIAQSVSSPDAFLARLGLTADLPVSEAAYAPDVERTVQATLGFQTLRSPLATLMGVGSRASTGDDRMSREKLNLSAGIEGLSVDNPFALVWPQILPNIVSLVRCIHSLWRPPIRARLLGHPVARFTLATIPSAESDAVRRKSRSGDYEVSVEDLQGQTLVERWCRMLHDLRTISYNLLAMSCKQGALYLVIPVDKVRPVVVDGIMAGLEFIENRHLPGFCSRFLERYIVCCPSTLVESHVKPVIYKMVENLMPRLSATWVPDSAGAQALRDNNRELFEVYAGNGAMVMFEDFDKDELDELRRRHRAMLTSKLAEFVQFCLGMKGDSADYRSGQHGGGDSGRRGNRGKGVKGAIQKSKKRQLASLGMSEGIVVHLIIFCVGLIKHWGDIASSRKAITIAQVILDEFRDTSTIVRHKLSVDLFASTVDALVEAKSQLEGVETEAVLLAKNLYEAFGLTGAAMSNKDGHGRRAWRLEDNSLRKKLLSLPGVHEQDVFEFESKLWSTELDHRRKKDAMKDILRKAATIAAVARGNKDGNSSTSFWKESKSRGSKSSVTNRLNRNRKNFDQRGGDNSDPSSSVLWSSN